MRLPHQSFVLGTLLLALAACTAGPYYLPQTEGEALDALDRAADHRRPAAERLRWAQAALDSNQLQRSDLVDAWYHRGSAHYDLQQYEDALRDFDRMLQLAPDDGQGLGARAHALYMLGYYDECARSAITTGLR